MCFKLFLSIFFPRHRNTDTEWPVLGKYRNPETEWPVFKYRIPMPPVPRKSAESQLWWIGSHPLAAPPKGGCRWWLASSALVVDIAAQRVSSVFFFYLLFKRSICSIPTCHWIFFLIYCFCYQCHLIPLLPCQHFLFSFSLLFCLFLLIDLPSLFSFIFSWFFFLLFFVPLFSSLLVQFLGFFHIWKCSCHRGFTVSSLIFPTLSPRIRMFSAKALAGICRLPLSLSERKYLRPMARK